MSIPVPADVHLLQDDEGWVMVVNDDFGSRFFVVDPQQVHDGLKEWRQHMEEGEQWRGVYPGFCIDPGVCSGKTHCPRDHSCVE